jgi:TetR/AcrR family transcriptional regulator, transcriptional repressor for nem operon
MPYTQEHKQETRTRIIKSARRLFNRNGFADVTIDQIMAEAGLTHGGFYKHFSAKEDLYNVAVLEFIRSDTPERWQAKHISPKAIGEDLARMILDAYLSRDHYDEREASCPMIALPSDVARGNGVVKKAFREVLEMMAGAFAANLPDGNQTSRQQALALVALAVGGMVLARAIDDKPLSDEIRESARAHAFEMTGWEQVGAA